MYDLLVQLWVPGDAHTAADRWTAGGVTADRGLEPSEMALAVAVSIAAGAARVTAGLHATGNSGGGPER